MMLTISMGGTALLTDEYYPPVAAQLPALPAPEE
jgi:hypothetical protein